MIYLTSRLAKVQNLDSIVGCKTKENDVIFFSLRAFPDFQSEKEARDRRLPTYLAVISVITQRFSPLALRDHTKNSCAGDYPPLHCFQFMRTAFFEKADLKGQPHGKFYHI